MRQFLALVALLLASVVSARKDCVNQLTYFGEAGKTDIYEWSSKDSVKLKKRTVRYGFGLTRSVVPLKKVC